MLLNLCIEGLFFKIYVLRILTLCNTSKFNFLGYECMTRSDKWEKAQESQVKGQTEQRVGQRLA